MYSTLLSLFGGKNLLFIGVGLLVCGVFVYQTMQIENLQVELQDSQNQTLDARKKLDESNENNKKIIEAYEQSIKVVEQVAKEEGINEASKNATVKTITKYKTLVKEVEKKEVKQHEKNIDNDNFISVSF